VDSATNGACFYQEKNFVASDHVEKIWPKNKELNKYSALFLTTILNFENIRKEKILLPTSQNIFNWEYMKSFIKTLTQKVTDNFKKELEKLES
jgi:hypothetical protein